MAFLEFLKFLFASYPHLISFLGWFFCGEETAILLAILSAQWIMPIWIVFVFVSIGLILADSMWFFLGRIKFLSKFKKYKFIHINYKKATGLMDRLSRKSIFHLLFVSKFLIGGALITLMYIGRKREINFKEFLIKDIIVILSWVFFFLTIGWLAGKGFSIIVTIFKNVQLGVSLLIFFFVILSLSEICIRERLMKKRNSHL